MHRFARHTLIAAIAFPLLGCATSPAPSAISPRNVAPGTAPSAISTAEPAVVSPSGSFSDGRYVVGKDIEPGTYRSSGSSGCYWARLSGFGGFDVLANDNTNAPAVVTIAQGDKGFESRRCGTWTKELGQTTSTKSSFGDGTHIVGVDIEPGTYRNSGSSGCYWARLSGFGGSDIISNDNTNGPAVVTIAPGDKGFEATRCGTWTTELRQITASKTTFEDGTYIVGVDIEPGMYRNSGSSGCYWARLNGFGGNDIIANDNTNNPAVVTIAAGDKGFEATRCGTWTKR